MPEVAIPSMELNEVTLQLLQQQKQQGIITEILQRANQLALLKDLKLQKG